MVSADCCEQAERRVKLKFYDKTRSGWTMYGLNTTMNFCPFCGWDFSLGYWPHESVPAMEIALTAYQGPPLRICFDVDGLLAIEGPAYSDRQPYADAVAMLKLLKSFGHTIVIQTARYMFRCDGDQTKARIAGYSELCLWLNKHDIPYDEVYLGKAAVDVFLDDKGCRIESSKGTIHWGRNFIPILRGMQK